MPAHRTIHPSVRKLAARYNQADLLVMARQVQARTTRMRSLIDNPTPLDLAVSLNPGLVRTPALSRLAQRVAVALRRRRDRLAISMPPQEGKTTLLRAAVLQALQRNPDARVLYCSYGVELARTSGEACRNMIQQFGTGAVDTATGAVMPDRLGIQVRQDHRAQADWKLADQDGGLYCVGVGGGLTGRQGDLIIIDDPFSGPEDAWSEAGRRRVHNWYMSVATTRAAPDASIIIVATRWHELDLTGWVQTQPDGGDFETINIPALSMISPRTRRPIPDALGRPPGVWMESARGRTVADWERTRRDVGAMVFAALYQGEPSPPEGGVFKVKWITAGRVLEAPPLVRRVVWVDPAETGKGDAAGVLVGGRSANGHVYVLEDLSGHLTRAQWARRAWLAALAWEVDAVGYERTLGMSSALTEAWQTMQAQASALVEVEAETPEVRDNRAAWCDAAAVRCQARGVPADPADLFPIVGYRRVIAEGLPSGPCPVLAVTPRGDKRSRAMAITQVYELGRAHHVGSLPDLEHEMTTWQEGQPSPNRLDTLAHMVTHLAGSVAVVSVGQTSVRVPTRTTGGRR